MVSKCLGRRKHESEHVREGKIQLHVSNDRKQKTLIRKDIKGPVEKELSKLKWTNNKGLKQKRPNKNGASCEGLNCCAQHTGVLSMGSCWDFPASGPPAGNSLVHLSQCVMSLLNTNKIRNIATYLLRWVVTWRSLRSAAIFTTGGREAGKTLPMKAKLEENS